MKKTDKLSRWLLILIVFEVLLFLYCLFFAKEILIEEGLFLITGLFAAIVLCFIVLFVDYMMIYHSVNKNFKAVHHD